MKKYGILITTLMLAATMLTGCRNRNVTPTELPPTQGATLAPTTAPATMPTTMPTTMPETDATQDMTGSEGTENGGSSDATGATTEGRARTQTSGRN